MRSDKVHFKFKGHYSYPTLPDIELFSCWEFSTSSFLFPLLARHREEHILFPHDLARNGETMLY